MTTVLTPEQIAALTPEAKIAYYLGLFNDEVAAHQVTQNALQSEQANSEQILQELHDEKKNHQVTVATAEAEIGNLSAQLALQTKSAAQGYVTATVGDKQYKVIGSSFNIDGEVIALADLIKNDDLLKVMVAKGSGCLVPIS